MGQSPTYAAESRLAARSVQLPSSLSFGDKSATTSLAPRWWWWVVHMLSAETRNFCCIVLRRDNQTCQHAHSPQLPAGTTTVSSNHTPHRTPIGASGPSYSCGVI